MLSPQFRQGPLSRSEQHELRKDEFKVVAEAFLELFELLEDYAPIWYTEQHHNRAVVVRRILLGPCDKEAAPQ